MSKFIKKFGYLSQNCSVFIFKKNLIKKFNFRRIFFVNNKIYENFGYLSQNCSVFR